MHQKQTLDWSKLKEGISGTEFDKGDYVAENEKGQWHIWRYDGWNLASPDDGFATAATLAEAKLAAEAKNVAVVRYHATSVESRRHGLIGGGARYEGSWTCSCGARNKSICHSTREAGEEARAHREDEYHKALGEPPAHCDECGRWANVRRTEAGPWLCTGCSDRTGLTTEQAYQVMVNGARDPRNPVGECGCGEPVVNVDSDDENEQRYCRPCLGRAEDACMDTVGRYYG